VSEKVIRLAPDVYVLTKFGVIRSRAEFLDAIKRPDISWREFERLAARLALAQDLGADTTTRAAVAIGTPARRRRRPRQHRELRHSRRHRDRERPFLLGAR